MAEGSGHSEVAYLSNRLLDLEQQLHTIDTRLVAHESACSARRDADDKEMVGMQALLHDLSKRVSTIEMRMFLITAIGAIVGSLAVALGGKLFDLLLKK